MQEDDASRIKSGAGSKHADNSELNELSGRVIGRAFTVLNTLGAGFLEKVYKNALAYEVRAAGLSAVQQHGAKVHYKTSWSASISWIC